MHREVAVSRVLPFVLVLAVFGCDDTSGEDIFDGGSDVAMRNDQDALQAYEDSTDTAAVSVIDAAAKDVSMAARDAGADTAIASSKLCGTEHFNFTLPASEPRESAFTALAIAEDGTVYTGLGRSEFFDAEAEAWVGRRLPGGTFDPKWLKLGTLKNKYVFRGMAVDPPTQQLLVGLRVDGDADGKVFAVNPDKSFEVVAKRVFANASAANFVFFKGAFFYAHFFGASNNHLAHFEIPNGTGAIAGDKGDPTQIITIALDETTSTFVAATSQNGVIRISPVTFKQIGPSLVSFDENRLGVPGSGNETAIAVDGRGRIYLQASWGPLRRYRNDGTLDVTYANHSPGARAYVFGRGDLSCNDLLYVSRKAVGSVDVGANTP